MEDARYRLILTATALLGINLAAALYHGVLGVWMRSWWLVALCGYYAILSMTRFAAVLCGWRNRLSPSMEMERFVMGTVGVLLMVLGCALAGVNTVSIAQDVAIRYGEIVMITLAAYTFGKLTMAIVRAIRQRGQASPLLAALRAIGYAEAAVSVLTLQRSMLVSFGEMEMRTIRLMNALTGAGVFLFVVALGMAMIKESRRKNGNI